LSITFFRLQTLPPTNNNNNDNNDNNINNNNHCKVVDMAPAVISINQKEAPKVSPMREPDVGEHNRELYTKYCQQEKSIQSLRTKYKETKHRMDGMRNEGATQKKMILDMSDIVRALHEISIEYDAETASNGTNVTLAQVTNKIQAIDKQLKYSMLHTVQLQELKKVATSTITDQEKEIKSLENQLSLLEARLKHSDTHRGIMLPDTSYESQIVTMKQTIDGLQAKVKGYESEKRANDIYALNEGLRVVQNKQPDQVIDLTDISNGQPVSVTKDNSSYTTEEVSSHPSSYEDDYKVAKEQADELESENQRLSRDLEKTKSKMAELSESSVVLQQNLKTMERTVHETKQENEKLKQADIEGKAEIAKMSGEVNEAEIGKADFEADFEELERTVLVKVKELEKENSELKAGQEKAVAKVVELTTTVADAENIQTQSEDEIKRLQQENVESASRIEELTDTVATAEKIQTQLEDEIKRLHQESAESTSRIEELSIDVAESDQVKCDFEELERTVIARVEELEIENRSLKQNQKDALSSTSDAEETERAQVCIADLEDENTKLKECLQELEEENERMMQAQEQQRPLIAKKHPWQKAVQPPKPELEQLQEDNAKLKKQQEDATAKISSLSEKMAENQIGDEELQKATAQVEYLEQENMKLKTTNQQASEPQNYSEDMHLSTAMVVELEAENQRLRQTMISAEEAQKLREDYRDLERTLAETNGKLHSLQSEHTRNQTFLDEKSETLLAHSLGENQLAKYKRDIEAFEKLKRLHHAVVTKVADLGEDNGTLRDQLDETHAKLAIQQETVSILETIKEDYAKLMDEYDRTVEKLNTKEESGESMSTLRQDYADARAKIAVLQWENEEFNRSRDLYNCAEAKITMLERQVAEADQTIDAEKQKGAGRLQNMKDVIVAYKELEIDHQGVSEKLQKLRALMDGETKKSDEELDSGKKKKKKKKKSDAKLELLENQRNAAWEQMKDIEQELAREKQRLSKATEARQAREGDLKVVFQEYESLQGQYERAMKRVDALKAKNQQLKILHKEELTKIVEEDIWEDEPIEIIVLDDEEESYIEEVIEEEEEEEEMKEDSPARKAPDSKNELNAIWQKFGISKETTGDSLVARKQADSPFDEDTPFDEQAASQGESGDYDHVLVKVDSNHDMSTISNDFLGLDLKEGRRAELKELEDEHNQALAKLEKMESDLLIAQREAEDAKKSQVAREVNLRDTTAKLFKLEREHQDLQGIVSSLKAQMAQAKTESYAAEVETKGIRKHLETTNAQYKELQEKHERFLKKFSDTDTSKMEELVKENEDISLFCKEFMSTMAEIKEEEQKASFE
jgi:chromosome segregation ATPase